MSDDTAFRSIDWAYTSYGNLKAIKFFGGEPLLRLSTLRAASEYALKKALSLGHEAPKLVAITNATRYDSQVREWIEEHQPAITASIDGPKKLHDLFRIFPNGRGSFESVDRNIKRMLEETGRPTALECVYSPSHFEQGYSMVDTHKYLVERYGISSIILHPVQAISSDTLPHRPATMARYRAAMYDLALEYGRYLMLAALRTDVPAHARAALTSIVSARKSADAHCGLAIHTITVKANGDLTPCYTLIGHEQFSMGNIKNHDERKFRKVVQIFKGNLKSQNPICANCSILKTCHSCPGDMHTTNGSIDAPVSSTCDFLTGVTEGRILALNEIRSEPTWDRIM